MSLIAAAKVGAQGQINFNNYVPTANPPIDARIYNDTTDTNAGAVALSGTDSTFRAALVGGPTNGVPVSFQSMGTLSLLASPYTAATWMTFRTGTNAGYVAAGTDGARDSGLPYGSLGLFQVVIWQGTEATWQAAFTDFKQGFTRVGWSDSLVLRTSLSVSDPNIPNLTGLTSFTFYVPEPTSCSLMLIGLGGLVVRWKYVRSRQPSASAKMN